MSRYPRRLVSLGKQDFNRVFKQSKRSTDASLVVLAGQGFPESCRLGLAISKKHLPRAVDRNRVKRLVRESYRRNTANLPDGDYIVMSRPGINKVDNQGILQSLDKHWQHLSDKINN